ncbi:hypothetical protein S7711_06119 [Stachybotrys chartarum IBT 7711]|uniref:NACHT domain-containing protein n=1 Tax=Stachybotrys chartarum (strain CBS 109288 / IBT 7711) TaxID=1280523 RepID=A0A084B666_STACB|nr:hypothetical protein S7711_06119 [Stachybotrys chartarum IBT 7711]
MDDLLALTLLAEGPSSTYEGIDIVAIHGLEGGFRSWHGNSSFWLHDFLPRDLPSARIFLYGYRSSTFRDTPSIVEIADKLLYNLKRLQAHNEEVRISHSKLACIRFLRFQSHLAVSRPLIFICHSFGGLVLKSALTTAFQNRGDEALNSIVTTTLGIIFLGTPHSTSTSELYINTTGIIAATEPTKAVIVRIHSMRQIVVRFMNLPWHHLPWRVAPFYEELALPGTNDIGRFTSDHDPSYLKVLQTLRNITRDWKGSSIEQDTEIPTFSPLEYEVLESLAFEDTSANIPNASPGTCDWMLTHNAFKSWLNKRYNTTQSLWVRGKPGSGKSVMMKYILNHVRHKDTTASTLVVFFFFSHNGQNQSVTSLLKSFLYQLLKSSSSSRTLETFSRLAESRESLGTDRPWDDDVLMDNLLQLVDISTTLGDSHTLFVIDALDECNDTDRAVSLIRRLNSLGSARGIRICLSSRHRPSFKPEAEICMEDCNCFGIQAYLKNKLSAHQSQSLSALRIQQYIETITEKAQGVFLWVALVTSNVLRDRYLKPSEEPAEHLAKWLPIDIETAYEAILERLWSLYDARRRRIAQDALLLVLYAKRPLSILELASALAVVGNQLNSLILTNKPNGNEWEKSGISGGTLGNVPSDMTSQLTDLCGGLLELSPRLGEPANRTVSVSEPTVRFIHETAREFLKESGSSTLYTDGFRAPSQHLTLETDYYYIDCKAQPHLRLAQICLLYIDETCAGCQHSMSTKAASPDHFLRYSVTFILEHLSLAERMGLKLWQSPPFSEGFVNHWAQLHNRVIGKQSLFKPHKTNAAHVMSYYGLPWYDTGPWGGTCADINEEDHCGRTPIFFAAAMGQFESCRVLIELGADTNHRDHVYGQTPLSLAAAHGHKDVLKLLIDNGCDVNDRTSGVTPLWLAARVGHLEIVKLLLENGANPKTANIHTGETALSLAAALGHVPIVSSLLDTGADVVNWDKRGWTPLHYAVCRSRKRTLRFLLERLRQDQLHRLKIGLAKGKNSWVNTVLKAIILGLYFKQHGESQKSGSGGSQAPKISTATAPNQNFTCKRGRTKMDPETDEDDFEEKDEATPSKRPRRSHSNGRRLACPYHKRSPTKYSAGACNGKGFQNIYRLKAHLEKVHSRAKNWQRCHICQVQFRLDEIKGHKPCEERKEPTDYEDGFDIFQSNKLGSKQLLAGTKSDGECWCTIFDVLFPDWPKTREIPSPYQDHQAQANLADLMRTVVSVHDDLRSPATVDQIMNSQDGSGGGQHIRKVLERAYEPLLLKMNKLLSTTGRESPARELAADIIQPTSTAYRPSPNLNAISSTPSSQQRPAPLNMGENGPQINQAPEKPMGSYQNPPPYQDFPMLSPFDVNSARHSNMNPNNAYNSTTSRSSARASLVNPVHWDTIPTDDTTWSDYSSTGHGQWDMNGSSSIHSLNQRPNLRNQIEQPGEILGYGQGQGYHWNNGNTTSDDPQLSLPSGYQFQPHALPVMPRLIVPPTNEEEYPDTALLFTDEFNQSLVKEKATEQG